MPKGLSILLVCLVLLSGCAAPSQNQGIVFSTATPSQEPRVGTTTTTNTGPTRTPVPTELAAQMDATYQAMVLLQLYSELTLETAKRVSSGELDRAGTLNPFIAVGTYFKTIDDSTKEINPPDFMSNEYQQALNLRDDFRDIYERWTSDAIDAEQVITEITPLTQNIEDVLVQVETNVADKFNLDPAQLRTTRDHYRANVSTFFVTPTPAP
jgi:hypothetical protein